MNFVETGAPCAAVVVDVSQREQVHAAVREIVGALGPVDIVIPCAGICRASTVDNLKVSELEEIVRTNFLGMVYMIEAVLPSMLERKRGQIVGISSMAGVRGIPFEPAYSASKAAVTVYLESLRSELRPRGITITTVFPGYVQTPLLDEINGLMGADMSSGKAVTPKAAAARIAKAIERGQLLRILSAGARTKRSLKPPLATRGCMTGSWDKCSAGFPFPAESVRSRTGHSLVGDRRAGR